MARSPRSLRQVATLRHGQMTRRFAPAFRALGVCEHSWLRYNNKLYNINCTKCGVSFLYEMSGFVFVRDVVCTNRRAPGKQRTSWKLSAFFSLNYRNNCPDGSYFSAGVSRNHSNWTRRPLSTRIFSAIKNLTLQHGFEPIISCLAGRRTNNCATVTSLSVY